jgi:hypothetical protein
MKRNVVLAMFFLFLLAGVSEAQRKTTLSVMDINVTSGLSQKEISLLTDKLLNSLVEYRIFEVVERSKRDEILREQGFQLTGACSDASCLVEVGQLLGAQKMIGGTIGQLGSMYVVELRMIDIKTGGIDLSFSRQYNKMTELLGAMKEASEIFSSWKPVSGQSAKPGGLYISSEPEGAKIIVDGRELGRITPDLVYPLAEGLHQVSLVKEGYSLYSSSRLVSIGKVDTVQAPLMSLLGKLRIKTDPAGAKLYLNKKYQGIVTEQGMVIEDLTDSLYKVKVCKWGYRTFNAKFVPTPGRETKMEAELPLRRWKVNFFSAEFINLADPSNNEYITQVAYDNETMIVNDDDFQGLGVGGGAGVGFVISRNITLGLMYQFRIYPSGLRNELFSISGRNDRLDLDFIAHSPVANLVVTVPWGKLEPYGEFRFGFSNGKYTGEYVSDSFNTSNWTVVSSDTTRLDGAVNYKTFQIGGGFLFWFKPDREALRVYLMYSNDSFNDLTLPWQQKEVNLTASGLLFGFGLTVHF